MHILFRWEDSNSCGNSCKVITQSQFFLMLVLFVYSNALMNGQWRSNLTLFAKFQFFDLFQNGVW